MDRWGRKDDSLLWEPPIEQSKATSPPSDSDDEDEVFASRAWQHTLRDFCNSRMVSRAAVLLCLFLTGLLLRGQHGPGSASLSADIPDPSEVDWSRYAYIQYATEKQYLCNSIMIFEALSRLGSKASRVMLYPAEWDVHPSIGTFQSKMLLAAEADYGVRIEPIHRVNLVDVSGTWRDSFVKLLAFNQTKYERVLSLDSDSTVFKASLASMPL